MSRATLSVRCCHQRRSAHTLVTRHARHAALAVVRQADRRDVRRWISHAACHGAANLSAPRTSCNRPADVQRSARPDSGSAGCARSVKFARSSLARSSVIISVTIAWRSMNSGAHRCHAMGACGRVLAAVSSISATSSLVQRRGAMLCTSRIATRASAFRNGTATKAWNPAPAPAIRAACPGQIVGSHRCRGTPPFALPARWRSGESTVPHRRGARRRPSARGGGRSPGGRGRRHQRDHPHIPLSRVPSAGAGRALLGAHGGASLADAVRLIIALWLDGRAAVRSIGKFRRSCLGAQSRSRRRTQAPAGRRVGGGSQAPARGSA